jgi:glycosyltransferase involved in cell wall biosynthesis
MRVLTLSSPSGGICGIGDYNADLSAALRAQGHRVDILKLVRRGDRTPMVEEFRQRIANFDGVIFQFDGSLYGDTPFAISHNFINLIRGLGNKPGIAILHEGPVRLASRKMIVSWLMRRTMMAALNRLPIFVHSEDTRSEWIGKGIAPGQIKTIAFPLKLGQSLVEPRPLSETDTVELLMFGFIAAYKGYEIALNALRALPQNYCLTIAGDRAPGTWFDPAVDAIHGFIQTGIWHPNWRRTLRRRPHSDAERQSLERRVKFTGHVAPDRIPEIMGCADIVLLPYLRSSGSAALADAIEFARPTIATALPAFCEVAAQANCLRLVAPDAPFELAQAIRDLAGNLNERRRMFASASAFARAHSFATLAQDCISTLKTETLTSNVGAMVDSPRIDHERKETAEKSEQLNRTFEKAVSCRNELGQMTNPISLLSVDPADNANDAECFH